MKKSTIVINSFLDGFTLAGLLGSAKLPGAPTVFCEANCRLEESQFRKLFEPFLPAHEESTE
jgi:hypothetical protein